ncbi:MAG: acetate--CoA ligase family protein [Planctomycetes bacterium]|jgi:acyl-CoA synthetase (NDP forming)|nr:acetate--CoA ligase family protein [Planctomycetota bacterium]HPY75198.1 acetate--CoA ligase family protein [Planctomycetota bacterium]HQB00480.1 acetate--CoA ligase family protein [Planctomycetota bacterium]
MYSAIDQIIEQIFQEQRSTLLEPEVYQILRHIGVETPDYAFIETLEQLTDESLQKIKGDKVVAKLVSPQIFHKTDVGGVQFIEKNKENAQTVYHKFEAICKEQNAQYKGMLLCQMLEYKSGFGGELLYGIRWSADFGHILTAGIGGTETDLFGKVLKEDYNIYNDLLYNLDQKHWQENLEKTLIYQKVAGKTRGGKRIIEDTDFFQPLWKLNQFAQHYNPYGQGKYLLAEMEFNPLVISHGKLVALDAILRFKENMPAKRLEKPAQKIDCLLHPKTIGIVGVSSKSMNMGRIILNNLKKYGFSNEKIYVIKPNETMIDDCKCVDSISNLPEKVDMFIISVNAAETPKIIQELLETDKSNSVIIIPGGMGEKEGEGQKIEANIKEMIQTMTDPPVLVGGNCLGVRSVPGNYGTFFIPEYKLHAENGIASNIGFISQSGAFLITRMSKLGIDFQYAISSGNQIHLGVSDYLSYFADKSQVNTLAFYIEGFGYLDGMHFVENLKRANAHNKKVIVYKAGRTKEGQSAAMGHTASIAGEYQVCKNILKKYGAIWTDSFTEFEESIKLHRGLENKIIKGKNIGIVSDAGFESVGTADNLQDLTAPKLQQETIEKIQEIYKKGRIQEIANISNPLDITPSGNDDVYIHSTKVFLEADYIDAVLLCIVPLSPANSTLPPSSEHKENIYDENSLPQRVIRLAKETNKPFVVSVDSGTPFNPLVAMLEKHNIPVFRSSDQAIRAFSKFLSYSVPS